MADAAVLCCVSLAQVYTDLKVEAQDNVIVWNCNKRRVSAGYVELES